MLDMIHYKKFPFTEPQGKLPCSEKPSSNSCHESNHPIQTSHLSLLIWTFVLSSNQYAAAYSVQRLGRKLEDLGFKSSHEQDYYLFFKTSTLALAPKQLQLNENQSFFYGIKVTREDNMTTHIRQEPSLKISGAIPPLNLSATMAHIGTTLFNLYLLPMHITLKRSHPFWSRKGTVIHY
jgi:hypothetical protein